MAHLTGTYNGVNDALEQYKNFLEANGWTINLFANDSSKYAGDDFTGKRLHVYKSINGVDCYVNHRSCSNQRVYNDGSYGNVTGICSIISTGFDAGDSWDNQPGFAYAIGGCVDGMINTGGSFHFFDTGTVTEALFYTESDHDDFRCVASGVTSLGSNFCVSSGGFPSGYGNRSAFLRCTSSGGYGRTGNGFFGVGGSFKYINGLTGIRGDTIVNQYATTSGDYGQQYTELSPDPYKGNTPLPVCEMKYAETTSNIRSAGIIDGLYLINMKYYTDGQEITVGPDTFVLFRVRNSTSYNDGFAFKK